MAAVYFDECGQSLEIRLSRISCSDVLAFISIKLLRKNLKAKNGTARAGV